jgi:hypothetical protein
MILLGSVVHEDVPLMLAAIHAGDWLHEDRRLRSQDGPVSCSEPAPSPGNFRNNSNRFPSHRRVLKLLLRTDGVRHRNGHRTQPDGRRSSYGGR